MRSVRFAATAVFLVVLQGCIEEPRSEGPYVASSSGEVFYRNGCRAAQRLSEHRRIYFDSPEHAKAAGYRPSTARGCGPEDPVAPAEPKEQGAVAAAPPPDSLACVVTRIYDGDTVTCRGGERIRLLLVDAPEMSQGDLGRAARSALQEVMPLGTEVRVEHDVQPRDRYGRTLGYLWLRDGRMVNEELARRGYALSLTYPPNVRHVERIRRAVEDARVAGRGLWAEDGFSCTPREHRAKRCA